MLNLNNGNGESLNLYAREGLFAATILIGIGINHKIYIFIFRIMCSFE